MIDFTAPYFHSGVSLLAAPKTKSEIPLLAFLLPFSPELWIAIFTSLNITAVAVAVYEWLSPFGLNPWGRQRSKNFSMSSGTQAKWFKITENSFAPWRITWGWRALEYAREKTVWQRTQIFISPPPQPTSHHHHPSHTITQSIQEPPTMKDDDYNDDYTNCCQAICSDSSRRYIAHRKEKSVPPHNRPLLGRCVEAARRPALPDGSSSGVV